MSMETYEAVQQLLSKLDSEEYRVKLPADESVYSSEIIQPDSDGCVAVNPMIGDDEQLFGHADTVANGRGIMTLLKRRVSGCKAPEELYEPEIVFLVTAIRSVTFSSEYNVPFVCSSCGEQHEATVDANAFRNVHYGKEDIFKSFEMSNGQIIRYQHLPFMKELAMEPENIVKAKIVSVDGIEDKTAIGKWIEALKLPLRKELNRELNKPLGGFETDNIPVQCPSCEAENFVTVDTLTGFFIDVLLA